MVLLEITTTLQRRIIEAAEICIRKKGISQIRMQDVADEAEVSMATLYRHVGGKNELLLAVLMAEAEKLLVRVEAVVALEPDPVDALVNGVLFLVRETLKNETLTAVLVSDEFRDILAAPGAFEATVGKGAKFVEPLLARTPSRRRRPDVTPAEASEWVTRIVHSMLQVPTYMSRDDDEWRSYLHRLLAPSLFSVPRSRPPRPVTDRGAGGVGSDNRL